VGNETFHQRRAAEALEAAQALQPTHPAWALVPLFYSAMHLMHACFDRDYLPEPRRHPDGHVNRWSQGQVVSWGTTDVVRTHYPPRVSKAYTDLFEGGRTTRYSFPPKGNGERFWQAYEVIRQFAEERLRP
jgi:hypothetical protein